MRGRLQQQAARYNGVAGPGLRDSLWGRKFFLSFAPENPMLGPFHLFQDPTRTLDCHRVQQQRGMFERLLRGHDRLSLSTRNYVHETALMSAPVSRKSEPHCEERRVRSASGKESSASQGISCRPDCSRS